MSKLPKVLVVLLAASAWCSAQETHRLTLEQSVSLALQKGFAASDIKARYVAAKKNAESARRRLWTSVGLTGSIPDFQESLSQQFDPVAGRFAYYQLTTKDVQGQLTINQPLVFTGGNLRVSGQLLGRDQTSGITGSTLEWKDYLSNLAVEFSQPILTPNLSGITQTSNEIALAQAQTDFVANQMDLVYNVTESFFTVYRLEQSLAIAGDLVSQNEEAYATARSKFEAGLIPEVEALQAEADLAASRNDRLTAERDLARSKNAFRLLLGVPTEEGIEVTGEIAYQPVSIDSTIAVESALKNRTEVLAAERRRTLTEGDIGTARSRNGFRVDLSARYGLDRDDTLFANVFHNFNRSRSVSLTLSAPLFDWGSNSLGVEAAEVLHKNAEDALAYMQQEVRQQVIDLLNGVRVAESRIHVLEKSVAVAQKGYDISLQRFRNGTVTRNDLALAQQRLTLAKTNSLNALVDYKLGLADLTRKTLWDFENNAAKQPVLSGEGE